MRKPTEPLFFRFARMWVPALLLATGHSVAAQPSPTGNEVVGVSVATVGQHVRLLWQRTDFSGCAERFCDVTGFEAGRAGGWGGGTAVNGDVPPNLSGSRGGIWISNGRTIAQVDPGGCTFTCRAQAAPVASPSSDVTGLAYWEQETALFMSDSANLIYWITPNGCTLPAVACDHFQQNVVPAGSVIAGLATDDIKRRLFVSAANFQGGAPDNRIWVVSLGVPQRPIAPGFGAGARCEMSVPVCSGVSLGPITGLGFDGCTDTLYYTDGRTVVASRVVYNVAQGSCALTLLGCCRNTSGRFQTGLCVMQKQPTPVGQSCVAPPCQACPAMVAGTYGAAYLGNRNFAITLRNAPTGSSPAFLAIAAGACDSVGVNIGFCSNVHINLTLPPILLAVRVTSSGATACEGDATISLGVPPLPTLCGQPVSAQFAMVCAGASGNGTAISNCVTFELTTN